MQIIPSTRPVLGTGPLKNEQIIDQIIYLKYNAKSYSLLIGAI